MLLWSTFTCLCLPMARLAITQASPPEHLRDHLLQDPGPWTWRDDSPEHWRACTGRGELRTVAPDYCTRIRDIAAAACFSDLPAYNEIVRRLPG
jgi:hypothetical protein